MAIGKDKYQHRDPPAVYQNKVYLEGKGEKSAKKEYRKLLCKLIAEGILFLEGIPQ